MVKNGFLKISIVLLLLVFLASSVYSQPRKYFVISGKVITEMKKNCDGTILIEKKDKKPVQCSIQGDSRFRLELDFNSEYTLTFKQDGYISKSIDINTSVPDEAMNRPTNFSNFLMAVRLQKDTTEPQNIYLGNQRQHILYSPAKDEFEIGTLMSNALLTKNGN
jgi:hypothetical protein